MTTRTSRKAMDNYLNEAGRLLLRAEETTSTADRYWLMRRAAEAFRRGGFEQAAVLTDRQANRALEL